MTKLKIAITINYIAVGGSQTFAFSLARGLANLGHEVFIYDFNLPFFIESLENLKSPLLLNSSNIKLFKFKIPFPEYIYRHVIKIRLLEIFITWFLNKVRVKKFSNFVRENKIQLVSSHLMGADTLSGLALKSFPEVVHCVSMHGSYEGYPQVAKKKLRELIFSRVNGIVYLTQRNLEFLKALKYVNSKVDIIKIYNGYLFEIFNNSNSKVSRLDLGISEDAFVFIQVARGAKNKGWEESIEAFIMASKSTKFEIFLLLIGGGEYLEELKVKYQNYSRIIFYGYAGNPIPFIEIANVGLLPTYYSGESLPNSVIEYLYLGKPVLASGNGEIAEMIGANSESPAGYALPLSFTNGVNIEELYEKMILYIEDKIVYYKHQINAIVQSKKFDMDICANSYSSFFLKLYHQIQK
ncbi:MAG: glycosyltransferase family 4 protein [Bacteroidota bacterium]